LSDHGYEWVSIHAEAGSGTTFRFIRFGTSMGRADFFVVFPTSQKNSCSLLIPTWVKKKNETWRAGERSVSFKPSALGRRKRGEQPKVLKQRARRAECSLLAQESYFICFKLDQIYRR